MEGSKSSQADPPVATGSARQSSFLRTRPGYGPVKGAHCRPLLALLGEADFYFSGLSDGWFCALVSFGADAPPLEGRGIGAFFVLSGGRF